MKSERPKFAAHLHKSSTAGRGGEGSKNIMISNYMDQNLRDDERNNSMSEKLDESGSSFQSSSEIEEQGKYFVGSITKKEEEEKSALIFKSKQETEE